MERAPSERGRGTQARTARYVALLVLLAHLLGCGNGDDTPSTGPAAQKAQASWFPAAPFRDDIRLPEASQARPWQPPAEGPVPVVEVLRDGSWILDGELIEGDGKARREVLETQLCEITVGVHYHKR